MLIDHIDNTTIITQEKVAIKDLISKVNTIYNSLENKNIIINLVSLDTISNTDVIDFLQLSNLHRKAKHSFVLVSDKIDIENAPEELLIVPTLQEAHDIIEMEEMERDLGL